MSGTSIRVRITASLILLLGVLAGFFAGANWIPGLGDLPGFFRFIRPYRLGCDLLGGTELRYRADFSNFSGGSQSEAMAGLRDVIERRINLFGVAEPLVQTEQRGSDRGLVVQLCGISNISEAIARIGETPALEFKPPLAEDETKAILDAQKRGERLGEDPFFGPAALSGRELAQAELQFDQTTNAPVIGITFTDEGAKKFEALTEAFMGKPLGIYLDGAPLSTPVVQEKISGGKAQITGQFTVSEARDLVRRLNSGVLPVPIVLESQQTIGASLGAESLAKSLVAAVIGFVAVALFMILWYRLPGAVAVVALLVYAALILSLFKMIPVTLTAAGIAGFILSLGMAVDANILIFERMKEELARGKQISEAMSEGWARAWTSIRDSNVSSLITAVVLYWLGTSVVKGFALTLGIGVLVSMFSAITVSRTLLMSITPARANRSKFLFLSGFFRSI